MTTFLIFVLWCLATIGATIIITQSKLFKPIRERFKPTSTLGALIRCPLCTGFHFGWFMRMLFIEQFPHWELNTGIYIRQLYTLTNWCIFVGDLFIFACVSSILSITAYLILNKLGFDDL